MARKQYDAKGREVFSICPEIYQDAAGYRILGKTVRADGARSEGEPGHQLGRDTTAQHDPTEEGATGD